MEKQELINKLAREKAILEKRIAEINSTLNLLSSLEVKNEG